MKKLLKISLLCSALWLAGCGDDTQSSGAPTISYEPHIAKALTRETQIKFQLSGANPSVPLPSYALMNPQDGTLNLPTDGDNSPSNPRVAMNQLDGWSTTMPLYLDFTGGNLATGAITDGVYLVELTDSMTGSPQTKAYSESSYFVEVKAFSDAATNKIAIYPTKPLNPASNYILAITSEVEDAQGEPIGTSSSYATLKSKQRIYSQGQLAQLQKITHGTEALFSATVDAEQIVYSTWFSTQSVGDTLNAVAAATAFGAGQGNPLAVWQQTFVHQNDAYQMTFEDPKPFAEALNADKAFEQYIKASKELLIAAYDQSVTDPDKSVYVTRGKVTLPYYLETGANWNTQAFSAASPSLAKISAALKDPVEQAHLTAQLMGAGIDLAELATSQEQQMKLVGLELTKTDGSRLDSERLITRYSPLPSIKSLQTVPFLLFTPKTGEVKNVVIYQHGITSAKENAYAFAFRLAQAGLAVITIDMPLHGERSLDEQRSANTNVLAYLNLANLPVARDNVRQSILDVLALRAALTLSQSTFTDSPLKDVNVATGSQIKLLGHSLGGIVGLSALAASEQDLGNPQANALYRFSAAAIHNSGGRIAPLLFGSNAFAPQIKHNLALTSAQYKGFADTYCIGQTDAACYDLFEELASDEQKAQLNALFAQFSFAAQSVLDSIDPMANLASGITTPLLLTQVHNDDTVPNVTKEAGILPFAGTEPVASLLGLEWVNKNSPSVTENKKVFIQYNATAKHSTFIAPQNDDGSDALHHGQMQEQTVDFFLNNQLNGAIPETVLH